jgi:hypothetical protein
MNAASQGHEHRATRPTAPADLQTEMSEEEVSEWLVRRAPQAIGSLIPSDLCFGADSLSEDLTFASPVLSLFTGGPRVRILFLRQLR